MGPLGYASSPCSTMNRMKRRTPSRSHFLFEAKSARCQQVSTHREDMASCRITGKSDKLYLKKCRDGYAAAVYHVKRACVDQSETLQITFIFKSIFESLRLPEAGL